MEGYTLNTDGKSCDGEYSWVWRVHLGMEGYSWVWRVHLGVEGVHLAWKEHIWTWSSGYTLKPGSKSC